MTLDDWKAETTDTLIAEALNLGTSLTIEPGEGTADWMVTLFREDSDYDPILEIGTVREALAMINHRLVTQPN